MTSKTKFTLIIGIILITLVVMVLTPWGSTNPKELGFYTSIGAGLIWGLLMYLAIKKFWLPS